MSDRQGKPDADRQLDELLAMSRPDHPYYLSIELLDGEVEFLADLVAIRDRLGRLDLTERQADWLRSIHDKTRQQIAEARANAARFDRRRQA